MSDLISRGKDQFHMLDTTYTFFFRFLFPHLRSNRIIHDTYIRAHFPSLSTYAITVPFLSTIHPSLHLTTQNDQTSASACITPSRTRQLHQNRLTLTYIYKYIYSEREGHTYKGLHVQNEITYETLVFVLTRRQAHSCLCETKYRREKETERENTDITLDYQEKDDDERKKTTDERERRCSRSIINASVVCTWALFVPLYDDNDHDE